MAKENTSGQTPDAARSANAAGAGQPQLQQFAPTPATKKSKSNRAGKPQIGGTAVPGARSTQPRQVSQSSDPNQQQIDSYNRTMRRRMVQMGGGESQRPASPQEQRRKRIERRKQRLDEQREHLRRSMPTNKITLGRNMIYFIIAVAVIIIALVAFFLIFKRPL